MVRPLSDWSPIVLPAVVMMSSPTAKMTPLFHRLLCLVPGNTWNQTSSPGLSLLPHFSWPPMSSSSLLAWSLKISLSEESPEHLSSAGSIFLSFYPNLLISYILSKKFCRTLDMVNVTQVFSSSNSSRNTFRYSF